jgi:hypothetical protein
MNDIEVLEMLEACINEIKNNHLNKDKNGNKKL